MTTISLVGNPNCGKTTIFNSLTGKSQKVGNWPGVTVDKKTGIRKFNDKDYNIVDLPGIYSIDGSSTKSIDEKIAGNFILSEKNNIVINIIDASNLEKNLFLTTELLDMNVPMILVLNMGDIAEARKVKIDIDRLSKRLGVAVIKMIANKSIGKKELLSAIEELSITRKNPIANVSFGDNIDNAINLISSKINSSRWEALEYLRSNSILNEKKGGKFNTEDISQIKKASGGKLDFTVINTRHNFIKTITTSISRKPEGVTITLSDKVDKLIMNRWASLPIFLLTIYM